MSQIDNFRATLVGGGARPSQFRVNLVWPTGLTIPGSAAAQQTGMFLVKATSLPASTVSTIEVPYRGRIAKIAGERMFQNWSITVINDNDFVIRRAIESWSQQILQHGSSTGTLTPNQYVVNMTVDQLDRNDAIVQTYTFHNVFPVSVDPIQLNFGDTNSIEEFNTEFSVDYWTVGNEII